MVLYWSSKQSCLKTVMSDLLYSSLISILCLHCVDKPYGVPGVAPAKAPSNSTSLYIAIPIGKIFTVLSHILDWFVQNSKYKLRTFPSLFLLKCWYVWWLLALEPCTYGDTGSWRTPTLFTLTILSTRKQLKTRSTYAETIPMVTFILW